jgi:peptidoglycan-associated lipoprotein
MTRRWMNLCVSLLLGMFSIAGCAARAEERPRTTACAGDRDCASRGGRVCIHGACHACRVDEDCGPSQRCAQNRCESAAPVAMQATETPVVVQALDGGRCFENVYFAYDDDQIADRAQQQLRRAAECLTRERSTRYVLVGRADPRGTTEYNLALGERRARAVQRFLGALGVSLDRLAVSSEGSEGATGTDESGWAEDRRVQSNALGSPR